MALSEYLKKYQGKTIQEVIECEHALEQSFLSEQRKESDRNALIMEEVGKHKYYKIDFNTTSLLYVNVLSIESMQAECVGIVDANNGSLTIGFELNRKLNPLWFIRNVAVRSIEKISEEDFIKMKSLYDSCLEITRKQKI